MNWNKESNLAMSPSFSKFAVTATNKKQIYDKEKVIKYILRLLWKKGKIDRSKLLVHIYRFNKIGKNELNEIMSELLNLPEVLTNNNEGNEVKGKIESKGDGIRGVMGNGPVIYSWKDLTK